MDTDRAPVARSSAQRTLTVQKTGQGSVTGLGGIDCGTECSATLLEGWNVHLDAQPAPGYVFRGWTGCTTVVGERCLLTVGGNATVQAKFGVPRTLTVQRTGAGTVTGGGLSCAAVCTISVDEGDEIVLTADPAAGNVVRSWTGCASVQGDRCTVAIGGDTLVAVEFEASSAPVGGTDSGSGLLRFGPQDPAGGALPDAAIERISVGTAAAGSSASGSGRPAAWAN